MLKENFHEKNSIVKILSQMLEKQNFDNLFVVTGRFFCEKTIIFWVPVTNIYSTNINAFFTEFHEKNLFLLRILIGHGLATL